MLYIIYARTEDVRLEKREQREIENYRAIVLSNGCLYIAQKLLSLQSYPLTPPLYYTWSKHRAPLSTHHTQQCVPCAKSSISLGQWHLL